MLEAGYIILKYKHGQTKFNINQRNEQKLKQISDNSKFERTLCLN